MGPPNLHTSARSTSWLCVEFAKFPFILLIVIFGAISSCKQSFHIMYLLPHLCIASLLLSPPVEKLIFVLVCRLVLVIMMILLLLDPSILFYFYLYGMLAIS